MHLDVEGNPQMVFEGHAGAVNSLSQAVPEELVSGSWDGTARIWDTKTGKCKHVLEGHTHAVAVLTLPNGITITGSQDKTIRIWYKEKMQKEIPDAHGDIIRMFANVPGVGFASCSNDETVKMWTIEGVLLNTLRGHGGFVFTLMTLATGEIASGGDDCQVKIWNTADGSCKQTIPIPRTVWCLAQNSSGDLIVGSEDYKIRVFSRDQVKKPSEAELAEYQEELTKKTTATEMSQFENAPDVSEQSKVQGKGDGDIQVFKKDGVPSAYMWKLAESKWEYVGEVLDPNAAGQGGGGMGMMQLPSIIQVMKCSLKDNTITYSTWSLAMESCERFHSTMGQMPLNTPRSSVSERAWAEQTSSRSVTSSHNIRSPSPQEPHKKSKPYNKFKKKTRQ